MKLLRILSTGLTNSCSISTSLQCLKKPSRLLKKQTKSKVSLSPKFCDNIKSWPKLYEAEREAQFGKLDELIAAKTSWREIEQRGLCVGNLVLTDKYRDVAFGTVAVLSGATIGNSKWLKAGTPAVLSFLDGDGHLEALSEGQLIDTNDGLTKMALFDPEAVTYSNSNYILMPSSSGGIIKYLKNVLSNPHILSSDSVHLINLAYRSIPMPSIHDPKVKNLSETLNESQSAAVSAALNPKRNLLCIQGPPGTGKTRVIAEVVHQLTRKKKRVLVCAPTHVAVRNAMEATKKRMMEELDEQTVDEQLSLLANQKDEIQRHAEAGTLSRIIKDIAKTAKDSPIYSSLNFQAYKSRTSILKNIYQPKRAIFSTLSTSSIQKLPEHNWNADVIIVDEAAQSTEPATWVAVLSSPKCKKLILVGDQKQLPAVVLSEEAKKEELNVSLMEKLADDFSECNMNILLKEQYRMNRKIMAWSNKVFYEDQLVAHPVAADITLSDLCPNLAPDHFLNNPMFMINMDGKNDRTGEDLNLNCSYTNRDETKLVTEYITRLVVEVGLDPNQIAVISPYFAQIEQLRHSIRFPVRVNTVDAFQGHERQVVIFCLVRDNKDGDIGFLRETRRLNVAITRAKRQFVLIGSGAMMRRNKHLKSLFQHLRDENMVFSPKILSSLDEIGLPS